MTAERSYVFLDVGTHLGVREMAELKDQIDKGMSAGKVSVVFDVSKTESADSSGVSLIVNTYKRCSEAGGKVALLSPSPDFQEILSIANVKELVEIHRSVDSLGAI